MRAFVSHVFLHDWRFRLTPDMISKLQCKLKLWVINTELVRSRVGFSLNTINSERMVSVSILVSSR